MNFYTTKRQGNKLYKMKSRSVVYLRQSWQFNIEKGCQHHRHRFVPAMSKNISFDVVNSRKDKLAIKPLSRKYTFLSKYVI